MMSDNLVELETFFPDIEPELPRCPTPVIENRIRDAIIDACERANIWRWDHPEIQIIEGQQDYDLLTPTVDTLVHSILSLTVNGKPMGSACDVYSHENHRGSRSGFEVCDRGRIHLSAVPTVSSSPYDPTGTTTRHNVGIKAVVSIKPSRTTLEVSEVLVRDYYQLIRYGSLAKALMMSQRPWTNVNLAKEMEKQYEFLLARAKQAIDRGFRTGSQRIIPRRFA